MFDLPIKVYGLKYSSNFSVSMNMISDLNNIIGILCQPIAFLEVLEGKTLPAFEILQRRAAG